MGVYVLFIRIPELLQKLLPGQHPPGIAAEELQHPEFQSGQDQRFSFQISGLTGKIQV